MRIKDRFRGLNLLDDPEELLPGESTVCNDFYLKGGSLVSRSKYDYLNQAFISDEIVTVYLAENILADVPMLFTFDINHKMRRLLWISGEWQDSGEAVDLGNLIPDQNIRFLEWEDRLIVYNDGVFYCFDPATLLWTEVPVQSWLGTLTYTLSGTSNPNRPAFKGAKYIIEFSSSVHGFTSYLINAATSTIFHELSFAAGQYDHLSLLIGSFTFLPTDNGLDTLTIYRKLIYEDDTEDDFYYYIGTKEIPNGISGIGFEDDVWEVGSTTFDLTRVNSDSLISDLPLGIVAADWYNGRVVWGTKKGAVTFSKVNNPFICPGEIRNNIVSNSSSYPITNMINHLGTFAIFTKKGIYHLVGTIGDLVADGTYQFYLAIENVRCYTVPRLLIIEGLIYFPAEDGLYLYDLRTVKHLGKKIRSLWYNYTTIGGLTLAADIEKKLVLVCIPNTVVLVYHYDGQFQDQADGGTTAGAWTTWKLNDTPFIFSVNREVTEGDILSLQPAFIKDNQLFLLSNTGNIDILECDWTSAELGGTEISTKRWLQIKTKIDGSFTLYIDGILIYNNECSGRYGQRGRTKKRSDVITLRVISSDVCKLVNFDITAERIGS